MTFDGKRSGSVESYLHLESPGSPRSGCTSSCRSVLGRRGEMKGLALGEEGILMVVNL